MVISVNEPMKPTTQPGILIVDDEARVRTLLRQGLGHFGFAVWTAADGREALEVYRQHRPAIDLVILDVRMPGLDGPQTLHALQQLNPAVRCCFISGDTSPYQPHELLALGACCLLEKPFQLAAMANTLWAIVGEEDPPPR
jgi:CheY-like chemotaxis protein